MSDTNMFVIPEKSEDESWQEWRENVHRLLEKLAKATAGPVVDEWSQEGGQTNNLEVPVSWGGPWTLECVLLVLPSGTTGATLTLGDRKIPVVPAAAGGNVGGLTLIRGISIPMAPRDTVRVDYLPAAGGVFMEATGHGIVQERKR